MLPLDIENLIYSFSDTSIVWVLFDMKWFLVPSKMKLNNLVKLLEGRHSIIVTDYCNCPLYKIIKHFIEFRIDHDFGDFCLIDYYIDGVDHCKRHTEYCHSDCSLVFTSDDFTNDIHWRKN